jgi:hypothetical protein
VAIGGTAAKAAQASQATAGGSPLMPTFPRGRTVGGGQRGR